MFNIHEMATLWSMQTLGSIGLLYWETCDQERRCIFMILTWYVENLMFFVVFVINLMQFNFDFFVFKLCYVWHIHGLKTIISIVLA
jgi:hypothetical protein